ncbi:MAG: LamG domain-containing protein [Deltaproteobacteria bacterium]|nr:LamG domain-containing protein [Deltaproteobacteria bacterium]
MRYLVLALLIASFVFLLSSVGQAIKDDESLVLYFPFDEGTGGTAKDESGNGNDGNIDGAKWTDGKMEGALSFGGGDSVIVDDDDSLDVTSITVEAWIKSAEALVAGSMTDPGIVHKWNPGGYLLYMENMWGTSSAYLPHGNVYLRSGEHTEWKADVWYHLAVTYDENTGIGKSYVNGVLKSDVTEDGATREPMAVEGPLAVNDRELLVGKYNNSFSGIIDEVAIYNRVLTEEEINQDMLSVMYAVAPAGKLATTWGFLKKGGLR